jgi:crossover junction endodeoxyribonuclease RusA
MVNKHTGKPVLVAGAQSEYLRYRADVRASVTQEMAQQGYKILTGSVGVYIIFTFPRPKDHWLPVGAGTKRSAPVLKPGAPIGVTHKPDLDKLCRAVLDALTGILYLDDAQVVALAASKRYADGYDEGGFTGISVTHEPVVEGITH